MCPSFLPGSKIIRLRSLLRQLPAWVRTPGAILSLSLKRKRNDIYRVEKRAITVGELLPEGFAVTSGLSENELIATAGLNTLMDGMQVRLLNK
jgi:hypothetical protein